MSGYPNDWVSHFNMSFEVGVVGLPITPSNGRLPSQYKLASGSSLFPSSVLNATPTVDPSLGPIYWWSLATDPSIPLSGVTNNTLSLILSVSGPGLPTPISQTFKVYTKTRKSFSIVDENNYVVSDLDNLWG
jgi:hypothetical protein